jgi:uncharacterized protein
VSDADRHGTARRVVRFLMDRYRWVIAVSVVLMAVSGVRTALTYSKLKSELEELLPKSAPSVTALSELRQRLPGLRFLGVVLEIDDPARAHEAEQLLDRLAERIRKYPPELVRGVRLDTSAEREFAERYALQLMDPGDVRKLREAVEARRDYEVSRAMGSDLEDEDEARADKPPQLPLQELRQKYQARFGEAATERKSDRFVSPDGRDLALLVQTSSTSTGFEADLSLLSRVQRDVAELGGAPRGTRLGYAGDVATRVEETKGLASDLGLSSVVVGLLVIGSLLWFYRSWAALVALFVPLLLGTWAGFALVALPPLSIRSLNTNTAFLGSIVVGNGINTGIMLLARIQEELGLGKTVREAVTTGVVESWRATLAAALASAASYASLIFTDFRGFNQFGWIGGIGIVMCWAATYALLPSLCMVLGERLRPRPIVADRPASRSIAGRVVDLTVHHRRTVLAALAILTAVSAAGLATRRGDWIEYDLSKLRRKDSWENGERYWGKRMDAATGRYLTPSVVMAKSASDVPRLEARLRELKERGGAGDLIAEVRSAQQMLPDTRLASIAEGKLLEAAITPKLRSKLKDDERALLDRALSPESLVPLTAEQLPEAFAAGLRERDGTVGRSVLIFPKVGGGTWQAERLAGFSRDIRAAAGEAGAIAAGPLLLSSDLAHAMRADGPRVTLLSFLCVLGICIAAFGVVSRQAWAFSGLSVATLLVGVSFMLGLLAWTGAKLNFSNFVALPITFGISADYSINMLRRFQADGDSDEDRLSYTSGALALCSAMTVIGWGALLLVENQALFSFGVFAISGELSSLVAATLALPAVLAWLTASSRERRSPHPGRAPTALG